MNMDVFKLKHYIHGLLQVSYGHEDKRETPLRSENLTRQALALAAIEAINLAPVVDDWTREV